MATTTTGLTTEETDTTNSATLSTMAASLALNNRIYSLDDFDTVATVGELLFVLLKTEVTPGNFAALGTSGYSLGTSGYCRRDDVYLQPRGNLIGQLV